MGVRGVRLNSIYPSENFPEHFYVVENLTQIEPSLGTFTDFKLLVKTFHEMNISLILDLPLDPFLKHHDENVKQTGPHHLIINNHVMNSNSNKTAFLSTDMYESTADVLAFWLNLGVNGFYLKNLQMLVHDNKFQKHIQGWKTILKKHSQGLDKILICSEKVIKVLENSQILSPKLASVLTHFDLIDCHIEITSDLKSQIEAVQGGVLFTKPGYPWPLWTLGGTYYL